MRGEETESQERKKEGREGYQREKNGFLNNSIGCILPRNPAMQEMEGFYVNDGDCKKRSE